MCGIKILFACGFLLTAVNARPEGYGVKGVKSHRATANAAASANAFANIGPGGSGIAQSSATANAFAYGKSNAVAEATANAFANGENIGKAISSGNAIANANNNPIGRSDVLDRSSHREKDTEYKVTNHEDGTSSCDDHIINSEHDHLLDNKNSNPGKIGSTNSPILCNPRDSKCRNSNPNPAHNKHPELSFESSKPLSDRENGWGANAANSGSRPCNYGDQKCSGSQPDGPNPNYPHQEHVGIILDSQKFVTNKPSVSNYYPSYHGNPDSTTDSSQSLPKSKHGWGGTTANPGSRPCNYGDQKCSGGQPDNRNPNHPYGKRVESMPDSSYIENPDLSTSQSLPKSNDGWRGKTTNPGSRPCTHGDRNCSGGQPGHSNPNHPHEKHVESITDSGKFVTNKPSVSNPYPSYNENSGLSTGSSQSLPNLDRGYGGHKSIKPTIEKDNVQGQRQEDTAFKKNPDVLTGSSYPSPNLNNDCGGNSNSAWPGIRPCTASGSSSGSKSGSSNPFLNGEIDVAEIQKAVKSSGSDSGSSATKPNPMNPFLNPHSQYPSTSTGGSTHSLQNPNYTGKTGPSTQYPEIKTNPSNPFLKAHNQHPSTSTGSSQPLGNPNYNHKTGPSTQYSESKPNPSNPFLNSHNQHASTPKVSTHGSKNLNNHGQGRPSDRYPESQFNPSNSFSNPHNQHPSTSTVDPHYLKNLNVGEETEHSNQYPDDKSNSPNSFSNPHSQYPSTSTVDPHHLKDLNVGDETGPSNHYPENKSNSPNSFSNPHSQHPSTSTVDPHNLKNPNVGDETGPSNHYPENKSDPSKTFLNPHNQHPSTSTVDPHDLKNLNVGGTTEHSNRYPDGKSNSPNSFTNPHNQHPSTSTEAIAHGKGPGRPRDGVKTYHPAVKGNSPRRPQNSPPIQYPASGYGDEASADVNSSWDAYSNAHAVASASAVSGGNGNVNAKSQASSSANASGWSNSWASSSASASASASASSYSWN